jgi:hypothetical protein
LIVSDQIYYKKDAVDLKHAKKERKVPKMRILNLSLHPDWNQWISIRFIGTNEDYNRSDSTRILALIQ